MNKTQFTQRQVQIMRGIAEGLSFQEIADHLGMELASMDGHLKRIRAKYDREGRNPRPLVNLVRRAIEDGVVPPFLPLPEFMPTPDVRPHSRACKMYRHPHGVECSENCPTCHGKVTP